MSNSDGGMANRFSRASLMGPCLLRVIALLLAVPFALSLAASAAGIADAKPASKPLAESKMIASDQTAATEASDIDEIDADTFCKNISDRASEQRYAWQLRNLIALQSDIDERIEKLEALRADVQDWIAKRDKVLGEVKEHIISVYERMHPEAAAERLASVDDQVAIALLAKMKPRVVSAILNEMDAVKASNLTQEMASLVEIKSGDRDQ